MSRKVLCQLSAVTFALLLVASPSVGQEPDPASLVTKHHELNKLDVGTWDAEVEYWAAGPDQESFKTKAVETNRLIGDGLWLVSDFKGNFGVPFHGHGTFGYDLNKKKHVGTWVDNMNTNVSTMEGTYDEKTKTMTMIANGVGPDGKPMVTQQVSIRTGKDTRTFIMSVPGEEEGQWVKMMEIKYTRRK